MTSSLVGSEMCIRDRLLLGAGGLRRRAASTPGSPSWDGVEAAGRVPVSYTHLTLPTICSV
eukprot:11630142-Prorocentrum_lima.AAC.1